MTKNIILIAIIKSIFKRLSQSEAIYFKVAKWWNCQFSYQIVLSKQFTCIQLATITQCLDGPEGFLSNTFWELSFKHWSARKVLEALLWVRNQSELCAAMVVCSLDCGFTEIGQSTLELGNNHPGHTVSQMPLSCCWLMSGSDSAATFRRVNSSANEGIIGQTLII